LQSIDYLFRKGGKSIAINISGIETIYSGDINALMASYNRVKSVKGQFSLVIGSNDVMETIRMVGLTSLFPIYASYEDFLKSFELHSPEPQSSELPIEEPIRSKPSPSNYSPDSIPVDSSFNDYYSELERIERQKQEESVKIEKLKRDELRRLEEQKRKRLEELENRKKEGILKLEQKKRDELSLIEDEIKRSEREILEREERRKSLEHLIVEKQKELNEIEMEKTREFRVEDMMKAGKAERKKDKSRESRREERTEKEPEFNKKEDFFGMLDSAASPRRPESPSNIRLNQDFNPQWSEVPLGHEKKKYKKTVYEEFQSSNSHRAIFLTLAVIIPLLIAGGTYLIFRWGNLQETLWFKSARERILPDSKIKGADSLAAVMKEKEATRESREPNRVSGRIQRSGEPRGQAKPSVGIYSITIQTVPAEAKVLLNGTPKALTPCRLIEIAAGTYMLEIIKEGYETIQKPIDVYSHLNFNYSLRSLGNVSAEKSTLKPGIAETPQPALKPPGSPLPVLPSTGSTDFSQQAEVPPPMSKPIPIPVESQPGMPAMGGGGEGTIFLTSNTPLVDIFFNERKVGETCRDFVTLPTGKTKITLRAPGREKVFDLVIKPGKNESQHIPF